MKILYLYTSLTTVGGADRIITQKANYLADEMGYDVYILTDSQNGRELSFPLSNSVHHIDLDINFDRQYKYNFFVRFFIYRHLMKQYRKKLIEYIKTIKPNIVISTMGRDMDFLNDLKDGSKKIGESHISRKYMRNFHLLENKGGIHRQIARYWRNKQEKSIKKLDAFVVLTKDDEANWKEVRNSIIIPNPMTLEPDTISHCTGKRVISVGRFSEQKGYDLLIKAWQTVAESHPDWTIEIYGEGELHDELERQIHESHLEKQVKLCAPVSNIIEKYLDSTFYVMSSRFEGFGLVLMEAMNCGLPCISFNCPSGPAEIIKDGEDGLLVENGNIQVLANSICYMIENETERIRMGRNAKNNIQRYSKSSIMKQWDNLFKSLMN